MTKIVEIMNKRGYFLTVLLWPDKFQAAFQKKDSLPINIYSDAFNNISISSTNILFAISQAAKKIIKKDK